MLQDLPATLYKDLLEEHLSPLEVKTLRLVSRKCRSFIDTTITALKPKDPSQIQASRHRPCHDSALHKLLSSCVSGINHLGQTLESLICTISSPREERWSKKSHQGMSETLMTMQHWELVKLFSNLESLDLRQHTEEACEEGQSPFEQLTALTRLKHLKVQWHKSWCNFTLTQVPTLHM